MSTRAGMILGGLIVLAALATGGWAWHHHRAHQAALRVLVQGGDGGGLPIAEPRDEHFDAAGLARAAADPAAAGLQAFVVMRHGHVVFARYADGFSADRMIDPGGFAPVLVALAAGVAVRDGTLATLAPARFDPAQLRAGIERGAHRSYVSYLSRVLWRRLNAAPAWILLPSTDALPPVDCCFEARLQDWLRIGGLLVNDGSFEDTQVIPRGWVAQMRKPVSADELEGMGVQLPSHAPTARSFDAADLILLRGDGHWRLWLVPSLKLVVLFGARADAGDSASGWDETRLPNLVIEALTDRPPAQAGSLMQQLVHGH